MMKLAVLVVVMLLVASVALAASPRAYDKASPNARFLQDATACTTEYLSATINSGSNITATVSPGAIIEGSVVFINRSEGQQRVTTAVTYLTNQPEMRLPSGWVEFNPAVFCIESGEFQVIYITISVSKQAALGEYFALLEFDVCLENLCAAVAIKATITVE